MDSTLLYLGGFALGCWHALDADHICAVSTILSNRQPNRRALSLAAYWAAGHGITLFILASTFFALNSAATFLGFPSVERTVGLSMVLLGLWVLNRPSDKKNPKHSGIMFSIGMLHGAAGSVSIWLLIPTAFSKSFTLVFAYIVCFSLGISITMTLYALFFNRSLIHLRLKPVRFATAALTLLVGFRLMIV